MEYNDECIFYIQAFVIYNELNSLSVEITWENFLADAFQTNKCGSSPGLDEEADHGKGLNRE